MRENLKLSVAHLYPNELNLYGDKGNILTLQKRCQWRNIELEFEEIEIGTNLKNHDLYFIGSGLEQQANVVLQDMLKNKDFYYSEKDSNSVFLAIDEGYKIFGKYFITENGDKIDGLSLLDTYTKSGQKRFTGNVILNNDILDVNIVGFENHKNLTYIESTPLGKVLQGIGNNGEDKTEGARSKNVFGTNLHGPLLAQNPIFADYLIELALEKRYGEKIELTPLDNTLEQAIYDKLTAGLK